MTLLSPSEIFKPISFVLAAGCFLVLCPLVILAQLVPGIPVFEIVVSYLPQIVLLSALTAIGLGFYKPRAATVAGAVTLVAALPFVTFSKFQAPSKAECAPSTCLTVITANVFMRSDAMIELGALAQQEQADLVAINETAPRFSPQDFDTTFPEFERLRTARSEQPYRQASRALTLLSRKPVDHLQNITPAQAAGRSLMFADLAGDWGGTRIVITHPLIPVSSSWTEARNTLLNVAGSTAAASDSFILMGDFNTTPWSSTFRTLPGRRAGDPRFSATWPTFFPLLGISIDHILASENLELVEFRVLKSVGSDHYPLLARFRRK